MLISKNKKMIAKSIALMLALVLTFSFVLTACKDKDARSDVTNLEANLGTLGDKVTALEEANKNNVTASALAETLAKYLETAKVNGIIDAAIAAALADYETKANAEAFVATLLEKYVTSEALAAVLDGYYTKAQLDEVKAGLEALIDNCYTKADVYTKAEVEAIKAELKKDLTDALDAYYTIEEVEAIKSGLEKALTDALKDYYTQEQIKGIKDDLMAKIDNCYTKSDVYTKIEVSNQIAGVYEDLKNYWTAAQVGAADDALRTELTNNLTNALKAYYDIAGVDAAIKTAVDAAVADITETLKGYYTIDAADAKIADAIKAAVEAIEADLALVDAAIADRYTKEEADAEIAKAIEAAKNNTTAVIEGYYTKGATDELIKGAKDYADAQIAEALKNYYTKEEVDGIKSALDEAIADLLAKFDDYFTAEEVDEYKADVDAYKLALEAAIEALAEQFGDYYTKGEVDDYKDEVDGYKAALDKAIADLLAKFDNYYDKGYIDTLIAGYLTKAEINEMFGNYFTKDEVKNYFEGEEGNAKLNALIKAYADANYVNKVDWKEATESVLGTLDSLAELFEVLEGSVYTKSDWDLITAKIDELFDVEIEGTDFSAFYDALEANEGELWIAVIRAISVDEFSTIEDFVKYVSTIPTAQVDIDKINALIKDLWDNTAKGEAIYTDSEDELLAIKNALIAFNDKYGFADQEALKNPELDTTNFVLVFTTAGTENLAEIVVTNGYDNNADYFDLSVDEDKRLRLNDWFTMQNKVDALIAKYTYINEIIATLIESFGEAPATLDDETRDVVADLVDLIEGETGFLAVNNNINTPITRYDVYRYYKWLEFKLRFETLKQDTIDALHAKYNELSVEYTDSTCIAENATVLSNAIIAINGLVYGNLDSSDDPAQVAEEALEEIVTNTLAAFNENVAKAYFAQAKQDAVAEIEGIKATVPAAEDYEYILDLADEFIADLDEVVVDETIDNPYTAATKALDDIVDAADAAVALEVTKVDAKIAIKATAEAYLASDMFTGDEFDFDAFEAEVIETYLATYEPIMNATADTVVGVIEAANKSLDKVVYIYALNKAVVADMDGVREKYAEINAGSYAFATEITIDGLNAIIALNNIKANFATSTPDSWSDAYTAAVAEAALVKAKFDNKVALLVGAATLYANPDYAGFAGDIEAIVDAAVEEIAAATTVTEATTAKDTALAAAAKLYYSAELAKKVDAANKAIADAIEAETFTEESTEVVDARAAIETALNTFVGLTVPTSTWEADYNDAVDAITAALTPNFLI